MTVTVLSSNVRDLPIAHLDTIDFVRLEAKDPAEVSKLLHSCQTQGFFYLALKGNEKSARVVADKDNVLRVMEEYFAQPLDIKMKDNHGSVTDGYKPVGVFTGAAQDTRDCYETLKVSRAQIMASDSLKTATIIKQNSELFTNFIQRSQHVTMTLLSCLSDALGLEGPARFENSHREGEPTNTTLVMLKYPKNSNSNNLGHNKHTDIGSITFLFSSEWGLQLVHPEEKTWAYVRPRPDHAIINVGDSLRFLSGKKLVSCLHRVMPIAGNKQEEDRYSIAYFLRPESNVKFEDVEGKKVTAEKWHDDKYVMFGEPHAKQDASMMLTGGMEPILLGY
ncbi:2OG-Fe-II oxygenase family oxidoreductase [Mycena floridula]|nr:2OG-Fe-II oxygenase family oxidoreductase [Mycena floridula]